MTLYHLAFLWASCYFSFSTFWVLVSWNAESFVAKVAWKPTVNVWLVFRSLVIDCSVGWVARWKMTVGGGAVIPTVMCFDNRFGLF